MIAAVPTRAGAGISSDPNPAGAARSAARAALAAAGTHRAGLALLFATPDHAPAVAELLDAARDELGTDPVGCTAHGVLVAGEARERGPGVAVLALSGIEAEPFLLSPLSGTEHRAGEALAHRLDAPPAAEDLVILLPDPYAVAPGALLAGLAPALGAAPVIGAGAVDGPGTPPVQWAEGEIATGGVAGVVLRGARPTRIGVTQACRPVTGPLKATRSDGHWLLEIDGRPALAVFRETVRGPLGEDLRRAAAFVFVALPEPGDAEAALRRGDYRVRNVAGFSSERGAIAVAEPVRTGETIAFVLREPHGARDDLKRMLAGLAAGGPAGFGVYLDCCARGAALFDVPGLEAAYQQEALGALPLVGMLGAYEIGPVRGRTEILTYTGILALAGGGEAPGQALA
jgi:small ligand-binding sensory domain FIST